MNPWLMLVVLGLRIVHEFSQGLIVRVNTPLCNETVVDYRPPRGRHFPEVVARRLSVTHVRSTGTPENGQLVTRLEKLLGVDLVIANYFEVRLPPFAHFVAPDETPAQGILKDVPVRHEFADGIDVARIDPLDKVHRYIERFSGRLHSRHIYVSLGQTLSISRDPRGAVHVLDLPGSGCETE
jgi:hypothetical protein